MEINLKTKCDIFIENFNSFNESIKSYNIGLNKTFLDKIEINLPIDYKYVLSSFNGLSLLGSEILGIDYQ